jgi:hypothetical protein
MPEEDSMDLYTIQLGKPHVAFQHDVPVLDTTVKSGCRQTAPTWDIVWGVKKGQITPEQYTLEYLRILIGWYYTDPLFWEELIKMPKVALGCYCPPGKFCHRRILVDFISKITEVNYCGELTE